MSREWRATGDSAAEWLSRLRRCGALLEGHFRLSSGLHSAQYVQCARLLAHPDNAEKAARALVEGLNPIVGDPPDVVVSPAIGGIVLGHEIARAWGCRAVWAERRGERGELVFRRGFELERGARVVAVEDVVTTAGSLRELVALVERESARVIGVAYIVDRSAGEATWEVPSAALVQLQAEQMVAERCPLCDAGVPVTKPGSRPDGEED